MRSSVKKSFKGAFLIYFCSFILVISLTLPESSQALFLDWYVGEKGPKYRLVNAVCSYIDRFYVSPDRINPQHMLVEGLNWLERLLPEVQIEYSEGQGNIEIIVGEARRRLDISKLQSLDDTLVLLKEGLSFVQANLEDTSKANEIEYTAINGMLGDLDPHSILLPPKEYKEFTISTSGRFGGLGMVVGIRDMTLTVISIIEGTPADRAGMKSGDRIMEIEGESTVNMSLQEAVNKLRGEPGTKVTLHVSTVKPAESEHKVVTLKREIIPLPSVEAQLLGENIGYIKIRNFQEDTVDDLDKHLQQFQKTSFGLKGIILDMRDNSGGLLDQAVGVSDRFLEEGVIIVTVGHGRRHREMLRAKYSEKDLVFCPMIVITDAGSASGSEIVAAALKENNRALLIGDRSFGKGTVQQLIDLADGSALKLTVSKYLTPLYRDIQSVGITPDVNLVPVVIAPSKENILLERGTTGVQREEDVSGHIHGEEPTPPEASLASLKYLANIEEIPGGEEEKLYQKKDLSKDAQVQIALELLKASSSYTREEMLRDLWPYFEKIRVSEEEKIIKALTGISVDWSYGKEAKFPKPVASLSIEPFKDKWTAGETVNITLNIHNQGEGALYRMYGIIESKNPLLDKIEFPLGKIEPGASKSYTHKIELPKNILDRSDEFTVKFSELNGIIPKDIHSTFTSVALPRPEFAFSYQTVEADTDGRRPDDDGLIQKGELIELLVTVRNIGHGISSKNIVTIRNLNHKEVFVEEGHKEIGELAPGQEKTVRLRFLVRETLEAKEFNMDLIITDLTFGIFLTQKLTFPVVASKVSPPVAEIAKDLQVLRPSWAFGGRSTDSPVVAQLKKGSVLKANGWVSGWYMIPLPNGGRGWVPATDVVETTAGKIEEPLAIYLQYNPPIIEFERVPLTVPSSRITLSGVVRDDQAVQHLFIVANNEKVFFKSQKKGDKIKEVTFNSEIPLKEGPNSVIIMARDNDGLSYSHSFVVNSKPTLVKGNE